MNEKELAEKLAELLNDIGDAQDTEEAERTEAEEWLAVALSEPVKQATTFEEAMMLTENAGVVLTNEGWLRVPNHRRTVQEPEVTTCLMMARRLRRRNQ